MLLRSRERVAQSKSDLAESVAKTHLETSIRTRAGGDVEITKEDGRFFQHGRELHQAVNLIVTDRSRATPDPKLEQSSRASVHIEWGVEVNIKDFDGTPVDAESGTLAGMASVGEAKALQVLQWPPT